MTEKAWPAWELEQDPRAINATDWELLPGMAKKRCSRCRYFFAVPIDEAEATARCPDCAGKPGRIGPVRLQPRPAPPD